MSEFSRDWPSVNTLAAPLVDRLVLNADELALQISRRNNGCVVVDAGIESPGSYEAGRRIAEICMAGLGEVTIESESNIDCVRQSVRISTDEPILSCLGSQYAGWSLDYRNGRPFRALGSGPARALAVKEPLFQHLGYLDKYHRTCMVIETSEFPPDGLIESVSADCGIETENLTLILTPTGSYAGVTQIAARVVEVALHKAHVLEFDLSAIQKASGSTPISPPTADSLTAMGRTNDSILFAGVVSLQVSCGPESAQALANELPSSNSRDYGMPFAEKFAEYDYDFFQIDPMLFSPAKVAVFDTKSEQEFTAGNINLDLLRKSFSEGS